MPLIDLVKQYGGALAPHLNPGERLLVVGIYDEASGDTSGLRRPPEMQGNAERWLRQRAGDPPRQPPQRGVLTGFDPVWGVEWNAAVVDRALGGVTASGGATSLAAAVMTASRRARSSVRYAVTTDRFMLFSTPTITTAEPVLALPRAAIRNARRDGRLFLFPQRGRVILTFADGSSLALRAGFLLTGRAEELVRSLQG